MSPTKNSPLIIVNSNPTFNFLEFGGIKSWAGLNSIQQEEAERKLLESERGAA